MKYAYKRIVPVLVLLSSFAMLGCEKDDDTANISFITAYPEFELTDGDIVLVKGEAYVEPGVVATEGGAEIPVTTSVVGSAYIDPARTDPSQVRYTNTLDTNVPGIYTITYSAVNSDGFSGSTTRTIFVLDAAPDPTVDLSGHYTSGTSPESDITKVADGVFYATNFWGGGSVVVLDGYILTSDGVNLNVPMQESLVPIYGYGTRLADGTLDLRMTRPTFSPPLIDQVKVWEKQ